MKFQWFHIGIISIFFNEFLALRYFLFFLFFISQKMSMRTFNITPTIYKNLCALYRNRLMILPEFTLLSTDFLLIHIYSDTYSADVTTSNFNLLRSLEQFLSKRRKEIHSTLSEFSSSKIPDTFIKELVL